MKLSRQALDSFKELYFKRTGERLTDEAVEEKALELLYFWKAVYRPIPKEAEDYLAQIQANMYKNRETVNNS